LYDSASIITISAATNQDYKFGNWSNTGGVYMLTGNTNSNTTIYINGPGTVTANFQLFDMTPPTITGISPANGSSVTTNQTTITASYSDRIAIDTTSVVLRVDGNDVTSVASITSTGINYPATLANGTHNVELIVKDTSGNPMTASWAFTVQEAGAGFPMEYILGGVVAVAVVDVVIFLALRGKKQLRQ
jgi:hypothetical protein